MRTVLAAMFVLLLVGPATAYETQHEVEDCKDSDSSTDDNGVVHCHVASPGAGLVAVLGLLGVAALVRRR